MIIKRDPKSKLEDRNGLRHVRFCACADSWFRWKINLYKNIYDKSNKKRYYWLNIINNFHKNTKKSYFLTKYGISAQNRIRLWCECIFFFFPKKNGSMCRTRTYFFIFGFRGIFGWNCDCVFKIEKCFWPRFWMIYRIRCVVHHGKDEILNGYFEWQSIYFLKYLFRCLFPYVPPVVALLGHHNLHRDLCFIHIVIFDFHT